MVSERTLGTGVLSAGRLTSTFHLQKLKTQTQMDENIMIRKMTLSVSTLKTIMNFPIKLSQDSYFCKGEQTRSQQGCPGEPRGPQHTS